MRYTLIDPKPLGDDDPKYGQTWWSNTHDSDKPVMFNLMSGTVGDGAAIEFEESVNKTSGKGTDYLRLRKVKVVSEGSSAPKPAQSDSTKLVELIYENTNLILERLTDVPPPKSLKEAWDSTTKQDTVVEYDPSEEPDLSSIPF